MGPLMRPCVNDGCSWAPSIRSRGIITKTVPRLKTPPTTVLKSLPQHVKRIKPDTSCFPIFTPSSTELPFSARQSHAHSCLSSLGTRTHGLWTVSSCGAPRY
uniref:Uncharacterized protein n=1 Tax=Cacopsylla melanoneura TaxID=428564 RepID=A0A8D8U5H6_9HEMI